MASSGKIPENVLKEIEEGSAGSKEYEAQKKRNLNILRSFWWMLKMSMMIWRSS